MEKEFPTHQDVIFKSLMDIIDLTDQSISPIANNILYHFDLAMKESGKNKNYPSLIKLLKASAEDIVERFLIDKYLGKDINLVIDNDINSLQAWDKIVEVLPLTLEIFSIFKETREAKISIEKQQIVVNAKVKIDEEIQTQKTRVYQIYRKLFSKRVLLTHKILPLEKDTECDLFLYVDITDAPHQVYGIEIVRQNAENIILGLPSCFSKYSLKEQNEIGFGPCLELTDQFSLITHHKFPGTSFFKSGQEILYFPFLFRPISLIIPNKGKLIPRPAQEGEGNTGSENPSIGGKVLRKEKLFYLLDIFSYFQY